MEKNEIYDYLNGSNYRYLKNSRVRLKEKLVEYKGGKCERCGYDKCITALEFHHLDPDEKEFGVGNFEVLSFGKCKKEVDKCILVCANCHREIHYEEYLKKQKEEEQKEIEVFTEILNNRDKYDFKHINNSYKFLKYTDIFSDIKNNVDRKDILKKYRINNRTFNKFLEENGIEYSKSGKIDNKPTKDELIELLRNNSKAAISRMFGVTWQAVNKWCKKYEI
jgi:arsenate reductase-like glutaredoxin family protein